MKAIVTLSLAVVLAGVRPRWAREAEERLASPATSWARSTSRSAAARSTTARKSAPILLSLHVGQQAGRDGLRPQGRHVAGLAGQAAGQARGRRTPTRSCRRSSRSDRRHPDELKSTAKEFAAKHQVENVALVVPHENENGPPEFKVNPAAEFTVTIYRNGKVELPRTRWSPDNGRVRDPKPSLPTPARFRSSRLH